MKFMANPTVWGATAIASMSVVATVAGMLYMSPPAQRVITFYTADAASVRPGDQLRIAGITVGKVKTLSLETDHVRVQARVDNDAFVGDKSSIEIRMLTVVGGYYVDLISLGDSPLGTTPIPQNRVTTPYSLIRALNDATTLASNLNAKPMSESLNEIQNGLNGNNVEVLNTIVDAGNSVMSMIDRQRGQITSILNLTDEYAGRLADFRDELKNIVEKIAIIEATLELYSKGYGVANDGIGQVVAALKPVGIFYANHREVFLRKVEELLAKSRLFVERNGVIIRGLHDIQRHLVRVLDVQQAAPELLATDLCIPIAGSPC